MSTATKAKTAARQRVVSEIDTMLQINGNTPTAHDWVPRVVMMKYEIRCANHPTDAELAECYSVAKELAERS
ncbi:hypothetical protein SAMN04515671_0059 [Nakamurella panacisegetis]|uniref:Uncharacterized protein n=1 Tax=Nakamurella panacisegetis TaxID=1090615 RepID=A0A1H0HGZ0_9ACTN|nr:hypothetical protein [Nakamurella panacisegetis]SDO18121.1 hypothetical protein SAMN04515671_0059 [Nakamurella panacisegetis]